MRDYEPMAPGAVYREYIEKAYHDLEPFVSAQTGLVHVHRDVYKGIPAQAAPTYENFLFVLLLFRRKTVDSIQQGKAVLGRLLSFQNLNHESGQYGNFPSLLTDYPECRDWHLPVLLCLVMTAIRCNFDAILGEELKDRLHASHLALIDCAQKQLKKGFLRHWESFVIAVQSSVFLQCPEEGFACLSVDETCRALFENREWLSPQLLGRLLASLTHLCPIKGFCPSDEFPKAAAFLPAFEALRLMWHPKATTYDGPAFGVFQFGCFPETTLFDFFLSVCRGIPLTPRPWPYIASLELALITPPEEVCPLPAVERPDGGRSCLFWKEGDFSIWACLDRLNNPALYGFHPIRVVAPSYTIVFHVPNGQLVECRREGNRYLGKAKLDGVEEERPSLIQMFVERHAGLGLMVEGRKATIFDSEKGVFIADGSSSFHFASLPSRATSLGHVSLGNRPGQLLTGHHEESTAYDWKVSIDYVRGEVPDEIEFFFELGAVQAPAG